MTAGRGIVHSEMPKVTEGDLWGFQLWINLPAQDKMVKPRYAETSSPVHIHVLTLKSSCSVIVCTGPGTVPYGQSAMWTGL